MELGFETTGNAILICHDKKPVLVTDPWICGNAYYGSWGLSHAIPAEQMDAIQNCDFVWISHGHPDHLHLDSLNMLRDKKIFLPDHVGGRIFEGLRKEKFDVQILKSKMWTQISDRVKILCLSDYNQDASLLVDIGGRLVLNMNDGSALGWTRFVRKVVKTYAVSFYLRLYGFGTADMINIYDESGRRLTPDPEMLSIPLGPQIARDTEFFGARYFVPFSSFHRYQRTDSVWAEKYSPRMGDYRKSFDSSSSEILPAFIQYDCLADRLREVSPPESPPVLLEPKQCGDNWSDQLEKSDVVLAAKYFQSISHLQGSLAFINLKVGGKDNIIELSRQKAKKGLTLEAPRGSLMAAIENEVFDDILIANFAKTILHGNWKVRQRYQSPLYPDFTPYVAKYGDNGRAKSCDEVRLYFNEYRRRVGVQGTLDLVRSKLEDKAKDVVQDLVRSDSILYQRLKDLYHLARKV